jgi:hypothetical protein
MSQKVNVLPIVKAHLATLRSQATGNTSLFAAILLSLIVLVLSFIQSTQKNGADPYLSQKRLLLREINSNISYTIVLSVAIVAVSLITWIMHTFGVPSAGFARLMPPVVE